MRKYIVLMFFALFSNFLFGQNNYLDVVYLKNGNIIRGIIIEQVPNSLIKIQTLDKSVFVFQMAEIEKITKEMNEVKIEKKAIKYGLQPGYKGVFEIGHQLSGGLDDRIKLNIINGYQLNPYFSIGIGTGVRLYYLRDLPLIPLFFDLRANFINRKVSPYFSVGVGYSFDISDGFERYGNLIDPNLGICIRVGNRTAINVGMGIEIQTINRSFFNFNTSNSAIGIGLIVGVIF